MFLVIYLLLTQAESLDNGTVAINVVDIKILQQLAATTYHHGQRASGDIILMILLQVLCQMLNTIGEQSNLSLRRTCIGGTFTILAENLNLLFFV